MDALPLRTLCAFCEWSYEGSAADGRQEAVQHRLRAHPEANVKRRPTRHLQSFRQPRLSKEHWDEVQEERSKRAWLLGIDLVD
jgi:hypothetical protein